MSPKRMDRWLNRLTDRSRFDTQIHNRDESNFVSELVPDFEKGVGGLLPAIAQEATSGDVLMMAWMNEESFEETMRSGNGVYFSSTRNQHMGQGE
ncbi:MAG: phosphoribosyl-AMP cyclohydrolase [Planctomycetota bacterium]